MPSYLFHHHYSYLRFLFLSFAVDSIIELANISRIYYRIFCVRRWQARAPPLYGFKTEQKQEACLPNGSGRQQRVKSWMKSTLLQLYVVAAINKRKREVLECEKRLSLNGKKQQNSPTLISWCLPSVTPLPVCRIKPTFSTYIFCGDTKITRRICRTQPKKRRRFHA